MHSCGRSAEKREARLVLQDLDMIFGSHVPAVASFPGFPFWNANMYTRGEPGIFSDVIMT